MPVPAFERVCSGTHAHTTHRLQAHTQPTDCRRASTLDARRFCCTCAICCACVSVCVCACVCVCICVKVCKCTCTRLFCDAHTIYFGCVCTNECGNVCRGMCVCVCVCVREFDTRSVSVCVGERVCASYKKLHA